MLTAIIPARFGSKRIKKKNIKKFLNKPIIYYSINAAKKSKLFDRIVVSTDSNEIKKYAISLGAECPCAGKKEFLASCANSLASLIFALVMFCNFCEFIF